MDVIVSMLSRRDRYASEHAWDDANSAHGHPPDDAWHDAWNDARNDDAGDDARNDDAWHDDARHDGCVAASFESAMII